VQEPSLEQTYRSFVRFGKVTGIRCDGAARCGPLPIRSLVCPLGPHYAAPPILYYCFFLGFVS
jgi:hypothetical protein